MGVTAQALHGAKVSLIPRPENNYQPLALRRRSLLAISGLIVTAKTVAILLALLLPTTAELSTITTARIFQLTNEERTKKGLIALKPSDQLTKAAAEKAQDMIDNDYFSHISPAGVTPWFWMQRNNYVYTVAGENLAIDFVQAEDVVDAWMASPSHRDNLLQSDYLETGIAVLTGEYQGGTSTVVVHMFGLPAGATRPSQSSALSARAPATVPTTTPVPIAEQEVIPVVTPVVVPPPAVPVISILNNKDTIQDTISIRAIADPGVVVQLKINGTDLGSLPIDATGIAQAEFDVESFVDGVFELKAVAVNGAGLTSAESTPQNITKDTQGPDIDRSALMFILSPASDEPEAVFVVPEGDFTTVQVVTNGEVLASTQQDKSHLLLSIPHTAVEVQFMDEVGNLSVAGVIDLQPSIFTDRASDLSGMEEINTIARRLILALTLVILVLLLLAVMIRIRIQHPRMIAHASLVILLAVILLFI